MALAAVGIMYKGKNLSVIGGVQCMILGGFTCTNACRICCVQVKFCLCMYFFGEI